MYDPRQAAKEPAVAKAFYDHYIFPRLAPHQTVGVVLGLYPIVT